MKNKDGLEPGQPVEFEELQRILRKHRQAAKQAKTQPKPRKRTVKSED